MDTIFNFAGMCVSNWQQAYTFFTGTLGLAAELNPLYGDWANLGAAWSGYHSDTHSMVIELFDGGKPVTGRWWGHNQNIRPAIHVADLEGTILRLKARGVHFTGEIESRPWGKQIEFETVEGIRWALAQVPGKPIRMDFSQPQFGHVAIKTADFEHQKQFYGSQLGFKIEDSGQDYVIYTQSHENHPFVILEPGGERIQIDAYQGEHPERSAPFFLSFMTDDIKSIAQQFDRYGVQVIRPMSDHDDWGGTDMVITDRAGKAIQIVQYW